MLHIPIMHAHDVSEQIPQEKNFPSGWKCYKTIDSYVSCAHRDMKHLGSLESTQETKVARGYALSNSWFRRTVLTHFENILEFKSTLKSTLTFKNTVFAHFQINLDFKATWIFRRWIIFTVSLVSFEECVNIILFNDSLERFSCSAI